MNSRRLHRLFAFLLGMFGSAAVSAADPSENDQLRDEITGLTIALDTAIVAGFVPFDPVSRTGEVIEFGTNLALKGIAPVFEPPRDVLLYPNASEQCRRQFWLPQTAAAYENWFGVSPVATTPSSRAVRSPTQVMTSPFTPERARKFDRRFGATRPI